VKVIYLPDPQFQDLAATGPSEVVSSRLEPGVDPLAEACRRGSILLVLRMGNIHLELPHTPAMDAPGPFGLKAPVPGGPMAPALVGPTNPQAPPMPPYGPQVLPSPTSTPVGPTGKRPADKPTVLPAKYEMSSPYKNY